MVFTSKEENQIKTSTICNQQSYLVDEQAMDTKVELQLSVYIYTLLRYALSLLPLTQKGGITMTSNVVNWLNMRESERANKAREAENYRHNTVSEAETERHNRATEALSAAEQAEKRRANLASEGLTTRQIDETIRHNFGSESLTSQGQYLTHEVGMANVSLGYANLAELRRHQLAVEEEQNRHNTAVELLTAEKQSNDYSLGLESNTIKAREARTKEQQILLNKGQFELSAIQFQAENTRKTAETITSSWNDAFRTIVGRGGLLQKGGK